MASAPINNISKNIFVKTVLDNIKNINTYKEEIKKEKAKKPANLDTIDKLERGIQRLSKEIADVDTIKQYIDLVGINLKKQDEEYEKEIDKTKKTIKDINALKEFTHYVPSMNLKKKVVTPLQVSAVEVSKLYTNINAFTNIAEGTGILTFKEIKFDEFDKANPIFINEDVVSFLTTLNKERKDPNLEEFITKKVKKFTKKQTELKETIVEYNALPVKNKNLKGILDNYTEIKTRFETEGNPTLEKLVQNITNIKIKGNITKISDAITALKTAFDGGRKDKPATIKYKQDINAEQQNLKTLLSNYEAALVAYNGKISTAQDIYKKQYPDIIQDIKQSDEYIAIDTLIQQIYIAIEKILKPITKREYDSLVNVSNVNCTEKSIDDANKAITDKLKTLFNTYKTDIGNEKTFVNIKGIYDTYIADNNNIDTTDLTQFTARVQTCLNDAQAIDQDYLTEPEKTNLKKLIVIFTKTLDNNDAKLKDVINTTPIHNNSQNIKEAKEKYLTITDDNDVKTNFTKAVVNKKVIDINAELSDKNNQYHTNLIPATKKAEKKDIIEKFIIEISRYKSTDINVFEKNIQSCLDSVRTITTDEKKFLSVQEQKTITDFDTYYGNIIKVDLKKINELITNYLADAQVLLQTITPVPPTTTPRQNPLSKPSEIAKKNYDDIIAKINAKCSQKIVEDKITEINAAIAQINTDYNATTANTTTTLHKKSELFTGYNVKMTICKNKLDNLKKLIENYNDKLIGISDAEKKLLKDLDQTIITNIALFNDYYTDKLNQIQTINDAIDTILKGAQDNFTSYFGPIQTPLPPGSPLVAAAAIGTPPDSPLVAAAAPALQRSDSQKLAGTIAIAVTRRTTGATSSYKRKAPPPPPKDPNEVIKEAYEGLISDDPTNTCSIDNIDREIKEINVEIKKLFEDYKNEIDKETNIGKINDIYDKYYNTNQHPYIQKIVVITTRIIECLKKANAIQSNPGKLTQLDIGFLNKLIAKFNKKKIYLEADINVTINKNREESVKIKAVKIMFLELMNEITSDYTTAAIKTYLKNMKDTIETIQTDYRDKQKDEKNRDTIEKNFEDYNKKLTVRVKGPLDIYITNINKNQENIEKVVQNTNFLQTEDLKSITELNENYKEIKILINNLYLEIKKSDELIKKVKDAFIKKAEEAEEAEKSEAAQSQKRSLFRTRTKKATDPASVINRSPGARNSGQPPVVPITRKLSAASPSRSPSPSSASSKSGSSKSGSSKSGSSKSGSSEQSTYDKFGTVQITAEKNDPIYASIDYPAHGSRQGSPSSSPSTSPVLLRTTPTPLRPAPPRPVTQLQLSTVTEEDLYTQQSNDELTPSEISLFEKIYRYKNYNLGPESKPMFYKDYIHNLDTTYDQIMSEISLLSMLVGLLDYTYNNKSLFNPLILLDAGTPNKNVRIINAFAKLVCNGDTPKEKKLYKRPRTSSAGGSIKNFNKKSKHKNMNKSKPKVKSIRKQNNKNHKKSKHKN
jgi:hypothetical protein